MKRDRIPRTASPLSLYTVQRYAAEARRAITRPGTGIVSDPMTEAQVLGNQPALRRAQDELHRRLRKAGIEVEGL